MSTENKISYKESLSNLREQLNGMLPAAVLGIFDADAGQLEKVHTSILKLKIGDKAPNFELPNALGKYVQLQELLKKGKVVLIFYRGTWCPYCNLQLALYQKVLGKIQASGASLVAISPQTPDQSLSMKEKNELKFEVLSDADNQVARQYTTVFKYGEAPLQAMADLGYDFDSFYGDDSREIPVPAVFIINQEGIVTYSKSEGGDYRNRVEPEEILRELSK